MVVGKKQYVPLVTIVVVDVAVPAVDRIVDKLDAAVATTSSLVSGLWKLVSQSWAAAAADVDDVDGSDVVAAADSSTGMGCYYVMSKEELMMTVFPETVYVFDIAKGYCNDTPGTGTVAVARA